MKSLGNKAPWRSESCMRIDCQPCIHKAGSCKSRNVTYSIICNTCKLEGKKSIYWGESHRTWWDGSREHHQALLSGD